jgi:replicative DNA helicase
MSKRLYADESAFLTCCYTTPSWIDHGLKQGLSVDHFVNPSFRVQWQIMVELRLESKDTDPASIYAYAKLNSRLTEAGGLDAITEASSDGTGLQGAHLCKVLMDTHAKRASYRLFRQGMELLKEQSIDLEAVRKLAESIIQVAEQKVQTNRVTKDIVAEALAEARAQISGKVDTHKWIYTGLSKFDRYADAIKEHEYVVIGARTSHGKSSLLAQIAGYNLRQGKKVAYFTLETSDMSVIKQISAQVARVNIRLLNREPMNKQIEYVQALESLSDVKNLMVFDRDLTLEQIRIRCRMLVASFKPDVVMIDYIGLIGIEGSSGYDRMSRVSKAMIPLKKAIGCPLIVAAQLNRSSEKEERRPTRSDFRDSGNLEEDAHRIIAVHRIPKQELDQVVFDTELLQLKCRDGGLTSVPCKFHSSHTLFYEEQTPN